MIRPGGTTSATGTGSPSTHCIRTTSSALVGLASAIRTRDSEELVGQASSGNRASRKERSERTVSAAGRSRSTSRESIGPSSSGSVIQAATSPPVSLRQRAVSSSRSSSAVPGLSSAIRCSAERQMAALYRAISRARTGPTGSGGAAPRDSASSAQRHHLVGSSSEGQAGPDSAGSTSPTRGGAGSIHRGAIV